MVSKLKKLLLSAALVGTSLLYNNCDEEIVGAPCDSWEWNECQENMVVKFNECSYSTPIKIVEDCGANNYCTTEFGEPSCVACNTVITKKCYEGAVVIEDACGNRTINEVCEDGKGCFESENNASCELCQPNHDVVCGEDGNTYNADSCGNLQSPISQCDSTQYCECLSDPSSTGYCAATCTACEEHALEVCHEGDRYSMRDCGPRGLVQAMRLEECVYGACYDNGDGTTECIDDCVLSSEKRCNQNGDVLSVEICQGTTGQVERTSVEDDCNSPFDYCLENGTTASCEALSDCNGTGKVWLIDLNGPLMDTSNAMAYCAARGMRLPTIAELRENLIDESCGYIMPGGNCNTNNNSFTDFSHPVNTGYCLDACNDQGGSKDFVCDGATYTGHYLNNFFSMTSNYNNVVRSSSNFTDEVTKYMAVDIKDGNIIAIESVVSSKVACVKDEVSCQ